MTQNKMALIHTVLCSNHDDLSFSTTLIIDSDPSKKVLQYAYPLENEMIEAFDLGFITLTISYTYISIQFYIHINTTYTNNTEFAHRNEHQAITVTSPAR